MNTTETAKLTSDEFSAVMSGLTGFMDRAMGDYEPDDAARMRALIRSAKDKLRAMPQDGEQ